MLLDILIWLIRDINKMHYKKKNYFQGGVSQSPKIHTQTIDYICEKLYYSAHTNGLDLSKVYNIKWICSFSSMKDYSFKKEKCWFMGAGSNFLKGWGDSHMESQNEKLDTVQSMWHALSRNQIKYKALPQLLSSQWMKVIWVNEPNTVIIWSHIERS